MPDAPTCSVCGEPLDDRHGRLRVVLEDAAGAIDFVLGAIGIERLFRNAVTTTMRDGPITAFLASMRYLLSGKRGQWIAVVVGACAFLWVGSVWGQADWPTRGQIGDSVAPITAVIALAALIASVRAAAAERLQRFVQSVEAQRSAVRHIPDRILSYAADTAARANAPDAHVTMQRRGESYLTYDSRILNEFHDRLDSVAVDARALGLDEFRGIVDEWDELCDRHNGDGEWGEPLRFGVLNLIMPDFRAHVEHLEGLVPLRLKAPDASH